MTDTDQAVRRIRRDQAVDVDQRTDRRIRGDRQLGASQPIRHQPVETHMLFGSFAGKATVNLCGDAHHEPA